MNRPSPWLYLRYLALPALVVVGTLFGGAWNFVTPITCFLIHPLLNFGKKKEKHRAIPSIYSRKEYKWAALSFVPLLVAVTVFEMLSLKSGHVAATKWIGTVLSTGIMNGILGFTLAHEFIHRRDKTENLAGHILLLQNNYLHYSIEHIGGHHVYACTSEDPHTAKLNESFYRFFPRAVLFTFINAWKIERKRLKRKGTREISFKNRLLRFLVLQALFSLSLSIILGNFAVIFLLMQATVAIGLLHVTNYLQHYGLAREISVAGQFERIGEHHAWRTKRTPDGLNLFQVDNHADHHMHPNKCYEDLISYETSPEMPAGYSIMILAAFMPPLWFSIMNKRLLPVKALEFDSNLPV